VEITKLADVVAFVLPGYLATEFYGLFVRTKKRDDFERLAVSLFFSLTAYSLACAIMWGVHRSDWRTRVSVSINNWCFVLWIFLIAILLGGTWAAISRWRPISVVLRAVNVYHSHHPNVWNMLWEGRRDAWVIVQLDDGTECRGAVRFFTNDPNETTHELWLHPVLIPGDNGSYVENPGLGVYIPGNRIVSVSTYRAEDQPAPNPEG
jgi:hypothetical protein